MAQNLKWSNGMKRYVFLLKNDIDFTKQSNIKLMRTVYESDDITICEHKIPQYIAEQTINRLSINNKTYALVEFDSSSLVVKIDSMTFFEAVLNDFICAQYGLDYSVDIRKFYLDLLKGSAHQYPHYVEMKFFKCTNSEQPPIDLAVALINIYFDERAEIISKSLCLESCITDIITDHIKDWEDKTIEIKNKGKPLFKSVEDLTLYQKNEFIYKQKIINKSLYDLLEIFRKMRNHSAHDLSLTKSIYNDNILKLTSSFIERAEKTYKLPPKKVYRFSICFTYLFNEIKKISHSNDTYKLGRKNDDEWNSFFFGS